MVLTTKEASYIIVLGIVISVLPISSTWDAYMLPIVGEVGKLRKAGQTSDILIRRHRYEETIVKRAFAVLSH
jgi:hypothetical protein